MPDNKNMKLVLFVKAVPSHLMPKIVMRKDGVQQTYYFSKPEALEWTPEHHETMQAIHHGLRHLANLDMDGATVQNDIGFNGMDTVRGRRLALKHELSVEDASTAQVFLHKYHRQLGPELHEKIKGKLPPLSGHKTSHDELTVSYIPSEDSLVLAFDYNPALVSKVKSLLGGRVYEPNSKVWRFSPEQFEKVEQLGPLAFTAGAKNKLEEAGYVFEHEKPRAGNFAPPAPEPVAASETPTGPTPESINEALKATIPMPSLTGSPRQIDWGRDVRQKAITALVNALKTEDAIRDMRKVLATQTSAHEWIQMSKMSPTSVLEST
jgi:hypothetical protein